MNVFVSHLATVNPDAKALDGFDDCIIATACLEAGNHVLVYSRSKIVETLMVRDGMSRFDAEEFFDFNVACACAGSNSPVFADTEV